MTHDPAWLFTVQSRSQRGALDQAITQSVDRAQYVWVEPRTYRITVEDITPVPEKPGWWYWDRDQQWVASFERQARIDVRNGAIESVVVHGTSDDRDEKARSLLDSILKAGKP